MDFAEFKERIRCVPYPESITYRPAILWLHPDRLPLRVVSVGEDAHGVIRIPNAAANAYGKTVPVIAVGKETFAGHGQITDLILPAGMERIPAGAFSGCCGLKRIAIPKKVTSILEGAFAGCDQLEDVFFEGAKAEWEKICIVHQRHEIDFGPCISGTPVQEIRAERLVPVPGNEPLLTARIHFGCVLSELE